MIEAIPVFPSHRTPSDNAIGDPLKPAPLDRVIVDTDSELVLSDSSARLRIQFRRLLAVAQAWKKKYEAFDNNAFVADAAVSALCRRTQPMADNPFEYEFDESPIPAGTLRRLDEATIRRDGCVWRVHKNDADPFPSNPHAHNVESGLKLDLSTGRLWFGPRDAGQSIKRKHLIAIRREAETRGFILPALAE